MAELRLYYILSDETRLREFLTSRRLIKTPESVHMCPNRRCGRPGRLKWSRRTRNIGPVNAASRKIEGEDYKSLLTMRCNACKTYVSPRSGTFFAYADSLGRANNVRLSYQRVLLIIYHWAMNRLGIDTMISLGVSDHHTVVDWRRFCRNVCVTAFQQREKMGGVGVVVEVDETLLRGKRKANRGRLLLGDLAESSWDRDDDGADGADVDDLSGNSSDADSETTSDYEEPDPLRRNNGAWVVGMCRVSFYFDERQQKDRRKSEELRLFRVDRRDQQTLHDLIVAELELGTVVNTDEWRGYNGLSSIGYHHDTVNHSENFVDPITGAQTQNIESAWRPIKTRILRVMNGITQDAMPSYLGEIWLRSLCKDRWAVFLQLLELIAHQYPVDGG